MTYEFALATAGALLIIMALGHAIMTLREGSGIDPRYLALIVGLGLCGGAAVTPFLDHLGG